ncbi:acetylglutamate kinase [Robiginitalea biformata]|uniref:Acetylglutamate kinase n=1 Tax=Robiginitalea biformata (strain ATCC BAA-864 / DSM 15991 / KCTC 12146 / HTCC2501) TaxID=313596 RepID=A4CJ56_ROBBH|nr:acetylglutamate kinase [Robiginitalea biformata]EAR16964.1 putative acetylglutamate kinase [Robiginitalea biformata HTCC2501]
MKPVLSVVKIGGAFLEEPGLVESFTSAFASLEGHKILVHGGGQRATALSRRLGVEPRVVDGRRITDADSLEVAVMVYAGWANKTLVARLQSLGCNALGVSGADAGLIRALKRPAGEIDYGFVGDIASVNAPGIANLLAAGIVPAFCALTHDGRGQLLNTNADTIASELAVAMSDKFTTRLLYCFEKAGVLRDVSDPGSVIPRIDAAAYADLRAKGKVAAGMLPKLHNCFQALEKGVDQVFIGAPEMLTPGHAIQTEITL